MAAVSVVAIILGSIGYYVWFVVLQVFPALCVDCFLQCCTLQI